MSTPALFSEAGVVEDGAFRTYLVDASLDPVNASQIRRGGVMYLSGNITVLPCDASNREPIAIASMEWPDPKASKVLSNFSKSTNIGDLTYEKARIRFITGQKRGEAWCLVAVPIGGTTVTITAGLKVVPSLEAGGGIQEILAAHIMATPNAAEINAALDEEARVIGTALTNIHTELDAITGLPSLGLNNADTLVAGATEQLGWVLVDLKKR